MTEIDNKKTQSFGGRVSGSGVARGIFRLELIEGLTIGDNRDVKRALTSTQDAGLSAGWHTQRALVTGHGYRVKKGEIERPIPADFSQVGSLDISEEVSMHTEESQAPLAEAVRVSSTQDPATQALATPISTRQFVVRIFSTKTAQELGLADLVKEEPIELKPAA